MDQGAIAVLDAADVEDDDVRREREECDGPWQAAHGIVQADANDDLAVLVHKLCKQYPPVGDQRTVEDGTIAVQDLSLRIRKGECFSLRD
jgi:hypothetical protein